MPVSLVACFPGINSAEAKSSPWPLRPERLLVDTSGRVLPGSGRELGQILEEVARLAVARLGVALLFQTEFPGRERYARGEREREGLRNGHSPILVKSTAGPVTVRARGRPTPTPGEAERP